jgi:hypothetical protein
MCTDPKLCSARAFIAAVFALLLQSGPAQTNSTQQQAERTTQKSRYALAAQAMKEYESRNYAESLRLFDEGFSAGLDRDEDAYNAACSAALAGDARKAIAYLDRAAGLGFRNPEHMKADTDLESVRTSAEFAPIFQRVRENEREYERTHADPERMAIITTDIDLFWTVMDKLQASTQPDVVIENEYFRRGAQDCRTSYSRGFIRDLIFGTW